MKRLLAAVALLAVGGCKKAVPEVSNAAPAAPVSVSPATTPKNKVIETGNPEFEKMLADFKANPKTKTYERSLVTFKMKVESVKELDKKRYLVNGTADGVNLVCTFLMLPDLPVNNRLREVAPGDKLTYWAEPTEYKPGDPVPTITSFSGSFLALESGRK
jgi:hypothetical protein